MTARIERTRNTNATAILSDQITVGTTTSTKIADKNLKRVFFIVTNNDTNAVWIKLQAASIDDEDKGIYLYGRGSSWQMPKDIYYTGDISAIAETNNPKLTLTEY